MEIGDFFLWNDQKSIAKTSKKTGRVILHDIVAVRMKRGDFNLYYKTDTYRLLHIYWDTH